MEKTILTKSDSGLPTQFRHVSHVGWDPEKGFDCEIIENDLKRFFQKSGVGDRQLNDKEARKFIYDFIEQNGGLEAAKSEANRASTMFDGLPVPKRQPQPRISPFISMTRGAAPLPPPNHSNSYMQPPPPPKPDRDASVEAGRDASTAPTGVNCEEIEIELKPLFAQAGISDRHLENKKTRKFIYKVIEMNGGLEAALAEAKLLAKSNGGIDDPPV